MSQVKEAVELFKSGCACSQAIAAVYAPARGLDRVQALRVAAGFGGGMHLGSTCGALTGAFMVLGLARGGADCATREGRQAVYNAVADLARRFAARNGATDCPELLGCDISTPEGMKKAQAQGIMKARCPKFVQDAAEILEEMLG